MGNNLPQGWEVKPLKDLCRNFKNDIVDGPFGSNLKRDDYVTSGIPVLKIQNIKPFKITLKKMDYVENHKYEELKRHSYKSGDIVITKLGAPLGAAAIVSDIDDGLIVADLVRVRAEKVDTEYLCYHINSPNTKEHINGLQEGATRPRVKISAVRDLPINLPPLTEQKRIVALLDEAFEGIDKMRENTKKNLQNARYLFQSYLQQICTKKEDNWKTETLDEVCNLFQGLAINQKTKHLLVEKSSLPLLRIKDLRHGTVEQYVSEVGYPINALVKKDEIVYTRTGQIGLVFRGREGVLHNNSFKVTPNREIEKSYLFWWLQHAEFKKKVIGLAYRAAQPDITHTIFKKQSIIIPPTEYQKSSVKFIEELSEQTKRLEAIYQQKLDDLAELKQSILQKAFAGELSPSNRKAA